ncbi:MAG: hypothetical protein AAF389_21505, partial [Gemmatimonadota bacterium]
MRRATWVWVIGTAFGIGGCEPAPPSNVECDVGGVCTVAYQQRAAAAVDVLFVVDDSCSMEHEQDELSEHFATFTRFFDEAETDYAVAVVTTDTERAPGVLVNGPAGRLITPESSAPAAAFREMVRVGLAGWGTERGLEASSLALTSGNSGVDFPREDADLSVIFVSDEE